MTDQIDPLAHMKSKPSMWDGKSHTKTENQSFKMSKERMAEVSQKCVDHLLSGKPDEFFESPIANFTTGEDLDTRKLCSVSGTTGSDTTSSLIKISVNGVDKWLTGYDPGETVKSDKDGQIGIGDLRGILKSDKSQCQGGLTPKDKPQYAQIGNCGQSPYETVEYKLLKAIEKATDRGDAVSAVDFTEAYKLFMEARSYA